jgi:peptide/nickel transport system substrate-binding protein
MSCRACASRIRQPRRRGPLWLTDRTGSGAVKEPDCGNPVTNATAILYQPVQDYVEVADAPLMNRLIEARLLWACGPALLPALLIDRAKIPMQTCMTQTTPTRRHNGWPVMLLGASAWLTAWLTAGAVQAEPQHGIAMHGEPALTRGFTHLPHVNPAAAQGGRLNLGAQGTFDSLNPFIVKGNAAQGVRDYVYESLMARGPDEPFSLYGLIAESVDVPADRSSITFNLRPEARFSDGQPITAEDVLFSHAVLKEKGYPYHRTYYKKVVRAEAPTPHQVRFTFEVLEGAPDREMPLIMGLMPILPKHKLKIETFERTTLDAPIGSGPYVIATIDAGRSLTYRKNPEHWARNLPVMKGRFNFAEIKIDYIRDSSSLFEAFKAGQIDLRVEDDAGRWAEGYRVPAVTDGRILKREFATGLPAGLSSLVFNTRKPIFADPKIRRALLLAFDFAWINRNLYHGLYTRTESVFQRSALASTDKPADASERKLLAPFAQSVRPDVLEGRYRLPVSDGTGNNRDNLRDASKLLSEAGYELTGETLRNIATKEPLTFEFLARTRAQERLLLTYAKTLKQLGIAVQVRQVDEAQYWQRLRNFEFDMMQWNWASSLSPGNEQNNRWSTVAADAPGSQNFAAVKSPAADAAIAALLAAKGRDEFTSAARALDRVIMSGDYVIPLFHLPKQWIAHWRHLKSPERPSLFGAELDTWWTDSAK